MALIAAASDRIAEQAMSLIEVDYEVLPAAFNDYDALKTGAPQLYDHLPGNTLPLYEPVLGPTSAQEIVMGDMEKGFAEADLVVEGRYAYDNIPNPIPMEPPAAVALWVSNQIIWQNKLMLTGVFGKTKKDGTVTAVEGSWMPTGTTIAASITPVPWTRVLRLSAGKRNGKDGSSQRQCRGANGSG